MIVALHGLFSYLFVRQTDNIKVYCKTTTAMKEAVLSWVVIQSALSDISTGIFL